MSTTPKKHRLRKLRLDEISLVDFGADPHATISIFKRRDRATGGPDMTDLETMAAQMAAATTKITDLTKRLEEAEAARIAAVEETKEVQKRLDAEKLAKEGSEEDILKNADPVLAAEILKLRKANAASEKRLAEMDDDRQTAVFVTKARADYANLPVKAEDFGPVLKRATAVLAEEDMTEMLRVLKAADNAIADNIRSLGLPAHLAMKGNAEAEIDTLAKKRAAETSVSFAKAYQDVLRENPQLYSRYLVESGSSVQ